MDAGMLLLALTLTLFNPRIDAPKIVLTLTLTLTSLLLSNTKTSSNPTPDPTPGCRSWDDYLQELKRGGLTAGGRMQDKAEEYLQHTREMQAGRAPCTLALLTLPELGFT